MNSNLTELEKAALRLAHPNDPCYYDHHGYCQAHFLHNRPCPMEVINKYAEELNKVGDQ